jgi:hypothetical protein
MQSGNAVRVCVEVRNNTVLWPINGSIAGKAAPTEGGIAPAVMRKRGRRSGGGPGRRL